MMLLISDTSWRFIFHRNLINDKQIIEMMEHHVEKGLGFDSNMFIMCSNAVHSTNVRP
jgi:hypothetical protein